MSVFGSIRAFLKTPKKAVAAVRPEEAKQLAETGAVIVDVREDFEWKRKRIPGAVHIPLSDIEARAAELPKDRPIVLHCAMGARSARAAAILASKGHDVRNLEGGIAAWENEGCAIDRAPPPREP